MTTLHIAHPLEQRSWFKELLIIFGASVIICLFGAISIPLPFTPVPIGTQCHAILLLSVILGSKRAALAVMAFLAEAAMGLPVCSAGKGGILHLLGPTGGYLFGYVIAAYATGYFSERMFKRTPTHIFYAMSIGNVLVYATALPWLSLFCGWKYALQLGMLPFLIGDFLKLIFAVKILKNLLPRFDK